MSKSGIKLTFLFFTGPELDPVGLEFSEGLNIVWGASNTGKSFALKTLDFMLGGGDLPNIDERKGYDGIWLGLTLPDGSKKTLYRGVSGGGFLIFDDHVVTKPADRDGEPVDSVGPLLLRSVDLDGNQLVKNANGQKQALTIRNMIHYLLVDESFIMAERSPVHRGQRTDETHEKNAFRLLLTGLDDKAVIASEPKKTTRARTQGKVEVIEQLLADIDAKIGTGSNQRAELDEQLNRLDRTAADAKGNLEAVQATLDTLTGRRREVFDKRSSEVARTRELGITIARFEWLSESYDSDAQRLEALAEAGDLLATRASRACSLCGAEPEHQHHSLKTEDLGQLGQCSMRPSK